MSAEGGDGEQDVLATGALRPGSANFALIVGQQGELGGRYHERCGRLGFLSLHPAHKEQPPSYGAVDR
jgi:hypothetical protein